jgi:D-glycerate 3-kinase
MQLGISAPQGCGKTTLVFEIEKLCASFGVRAASVSIDDFYLSHDAQQKISAAHPTNPLLAGRGNAGTHDLQLGNDVLTKLRKLRCAAESILLARCCIEGCSREETMAGKFRIALGNLHSVSVRS